MACVSAHFAALWVISFFSQLTKYMPVSICRGFLQLVILHTLDRFFNGTAAYPFALSWISLFVLYLQMKYAQTFILPQIRMNINKSTSRHWKPFLVPASVLLSWNRSHSESFTESLLWKWVFLQTADCGTTFTKEMQSHNGLPLYYPGHGPEFSWVLTFSIKLNLSVHSGAIFLFKAGPKWECWVSCLV